MIGNIRRAMGLLLASVALATIAGVVYTSAQPEEVVASVAPVGTSIVAAQEAVALAPTGSTVIGQSVIGQPQPKAKDNEDSPRALASAEPAKDTQTGPTELSLDLGGVDEGMGQETQGDPATGGAGESAPAKMTVLAPAAGLSPWLVGGGVAAVAGGGAIVAGVAMDDDSDDDVRSPAAP
jgi:hypothetical protein